MDKSHVHFFETVRSAFISLHCQAISLVVQFITETVIPFDYSQVNSVKFVHCILF